MNIRDHPLAYRWTNPEYAVLPDSILAQIEPVEEEAASQVSRMSRRLLVEGNLSRTFFKNILKRGADISEDDGRRWLQDHQRNLFESVVIAWQQHPPVRTNWAIFTDYWMDFCYPSCDDVLVWPQYALWALLYQHEEEFQFGQISAPTCVK